MTDTESQLLWDKYAEIDRLNDKVDELRNALTTYRDMCLDKNKLITEMADELDGFVTTILEEKVHWSIHEAKELINLARKEAL